MRVLILPQDVSTGAAESVLARGELCQAGKALELRAEKGEAQEIKTIGKARQEEEEEEVPSPWPESSPCLQDLAPEYREDAVVAAWVGKGRLRARDFAMDSGSDSDDSIEEEATGLYCADFSDNEEFATYDDEEGTYPSDIDYPEALEADE
jgi:hypothetical protein